MSMDPVIPGGSGAVGLTGTGTVNRFPIFTGAATIGNSHFADTTTGSFTASYSATWTANRTISYQDLSGTLALLESAQSFTAIQTVNLSGATPPVAAAGITLVGAIGNATFQGESYAGATLFLGYRTNGTTGAPTGVVTNDNLFLLGGAGRTSTGAYTGSTGLIAIMATETFIPSTNQGTQISFATTPTGSAARNVDVTIGDLALTLSDARNIIVGTGTGTKIGTSTTQKLGFFNATPVVQQNTTGTAAGFVAGLGTPVVDGSTFTGNLGATAYRISDIVRALKQLGLLAQ